MNKENSSDTYELSDAFDATRSIGKSVGICEMALKIKHELSVLTQEVTGMITDSDEQLAVAKKLQDFGSHILTEALTEAAKSARKQE